VQVNIKDLPDYGLHLTPSSDPSFGGLAARILGGQTNPAIEMEKPFSVILRNDSGKVLVAYSFRWLRVGANGKTNFQDTFYQTLTADMPYRLNPGGMSVVGPYHAYTSFVDTSPFALRVKSKLASWLQPVSVTISLDAAIFGDGTFVGPDETHAYDQAIGLTQSRRAVMQDVLNCHLAGEADNNIFQSLEPVANARFDRDQWDVIYRRQAAMLLLGRQTKGGAQAAYDLAAHTLKRPMIPIKKATQ